MTQRTLAGLLAVPLLIGLWVAAAFEGLPYVTYQPGLTVDVLGSNDGKEIIQVVGHPTYRDDGELRMTTVYVSQRDARNNLFELMHDWISRDDAVYPKDAIYPEGGSVEADRKEGQQEMTTSQENATVAALTQLGYTVPATLTVAGTQQGTDAATKLSKGDVLESIDGTALPDYQTLVTRLEAVTPGSTVNLTVRRDGSDVAVPVVTSKRADGRALIGVMIDPTFTFPVKVDISIDGIGGPSAGTMFALGIVDKLTPADEANGAKIAGTGTMDVTGEVGPIGGIRQKLVGARRDGAAWFLAPASNCDEVVGHVPAGLRVVKVATLGDAVAAMTAIGKGTGDSLPTCTAG